MYGMSFLVFRFLTQYCRRRLETVFQHLTPPRQSKEAAATIDDELEFQRLRKVFLSGKTRDFAWRSAQLKSLHDALRKHKMFLVEAVCRDFGKKCDHENRMTLELAVAEVKDLLHYFEAWATPEVVRSSLAQWPCRSEIRREPKGVVLMMSPWNYPLNLAIVPIGIDLIDRFEIDFCFVCFVFVFEYDFKLISIILSISAGALAGGNAVFCKLSRHSPHASAALAKVLREALDPEATFVEYEGGADMITRLLRHPWNHIFFTGSVDGASRVNFF